MPTELEMFFVSLPVASWPSPLTVLETTSHASLTASLDAVGSDSPGPVRRLDRDPDPIDALIELRAHRADRHPLAVPEHDELERAALRRPDAAPGACRARTAWPATRSTRSPACR